MNRYTLTLIFNHEQDKVLMQLHDVKGEHWNFPGGKIEPSENEMAASYRELSEETGIEYADLDTNGLHFLEEMTRKSKSFDIYLYVTYGVLKKDFDQARIKPERNDLLMFFSFDDDFKGWTNTGKVGDGTPILFVKHALSVLEGVDG